MSFPLVDERRLYEEKVPLSEEATYRKEIQDLFRDYRHPWDILTELVQNSVDAINLKSGAERGRIEISIDSAQKTMTVRDNGVGIRADDLKKVLIPAVSIDKNSSTTYGYKGVGLSFVAHLTKKFSIRSTRDGRRKNYGLAGCLDWVVERADRVTELGPEEEETKDPAGTAIEVTLCDSYVDTSLRTLQSLDSFFDWAKDPKLLEYILRTRTAIGNVSVYLGKSPTKEIDVLVRINGGDEFAVPYKLLTPFDAEYCVKNRYRLHAALDSNPPYVDRYLDGTLKDSDKQYRALRCDVGDLTVGTRVTTTFDLSILVCGETGVTELEREFHLAGLDESHKGSFELGTGVYLCINGMPTGILLHRWTDGFNKRFLCHVNVGMEANSELDKGRKGISEYTRKQIIDAISLQLAEKRVDAKYTMRHMGLRMKDAQSRGYAGTDVKTHLDKWDITEQVFKFGALGKAPLDENGVIFLFAELAGAGLLHGYELRYISQDAAFDFCFTYRIEEDHLDKHALSVSKGYVNTLGYALEDTGSVLKGRRGENYHVGEFKISAEDIVGSEKQPVSDLDLLVVWDFNQDKIEALGGTIHEVNVDKRKYDGVTHLLGDINGDCQVICLKELFRKLKLSCEGQI